MKGTQGFEPKNQAGKPGSRDPQKHQVSDKPKKRLPAEKTIEAIGPISGPKKTGKRKGGRREKDHQRRAKNEMVSAEGKFGKNREQIPLNHAGSEAEAVFSIRNRRRAAGEREAGKGRSR
jgi:hypothetical protein